MELQQAKNQFVQLWGNFGTQWGINRSMAQIHALLMVSEGPMSTDEIMEALQISRGNANMNIRDLVAWNLIYKETITGDRKEFFRAEKDMWEVAKRIVRERKRRELEPLQQQLAELKKVEQSYESISFLATVESVDRIVGRLDSMSNSLMKADEHIFFGKILALFK
ncbi:MAG: GbsR/MarR family transcriptional regulator [Fluviicola sp.]|jgi:DNA-binding transcriptional regulator GbsR (MarR family)